MGYGNLMHQQPKVLPLHTIALFLLCFVSSSILYAQDSVDVMKTPPHAWMKSLSVLEGVWEGEGEVPGAGKYHSTMTYKVDLNGHIIHHDYYARQGEKVVWRDQGVIAYDPDVNKILVLTIGIDGTCGEGEGDLRDSGYTITGHTSGATPFKDWRTIVTFLDDTTAKTRFEYRKGDSYEFFSEEIMRKKK